MNYLILGPEMLIVLWLVINIINQIKENYEKETIKINNKRLKRESSQIGKIILYNIIICKLIILYYINFDGKEVGLANENFKISSEELKIRILLTILFGLGLIFYYKEKLIERKLEYIQLLIILYLSTILLVIVSNLFVIYLIIELQSIIFYFLISWTKEGRGIKEGIDFFFQSIIFSLLLMIGLYFIYLGTETFDLNMLIDIKYYITNNQENFKIEGKLLNLGIRLIVISIIFKLGLFPFHLWLIKVLRGNNSVVMYFVGVFSKLAIFYLLYRWYEIFSSENDLLLTVGLLGLIFGGLGGMLQTRITNIFFYSSLTHMGLLLIIFTMMNELSGVIYLYYLVMYVILSFGFVYYILDMEKCKRIEELKYLYNENKITSLSMVLLMFSYIGVPPLLGFYLKIGAIISVITKLEDTKNVWIITLILVLSLTSLIMYLRISKNIVFGSYEEKNQYWFSIKIRENLSIEESDRIKLNFFTILINTGMIFWYKEIYNLIIECV